MFFCDELNLSQKLKMRYCVLLMERTKFHKKVYSKLDRPSVTQTVGTRALKPGDMKGKRIVPTSALCSLREQFKKSFLPLLIDIFELRQMISNRKAEDEGSPLPLGKTSRPPKEILKELEAKQHEVEEVQRWFSGVISQISKGIEEVREMIEDEEVTEEQSALSKLRDWMDQ